MKIIGHRGARGLAPENTIASLQKALEHHVDMIEFDLRVTKDKKVILHHDPFITNPDGSRIDIASNTYKDLKNHKADLATFEEVLRDFGDKIALYVEVKPDVDIEPIVEIVKTHPRVDITFASFSQKTLQLLHAALPKIPLVVLEKWSGVRARRRADQLQTKVVCMNQKWLWWGFIRGFKHSDYQLYAYTLNDPAKAARWARWGLSGVITDYPDRFQN